MAWKTVGCVVVLALVTLTATALDHPAPSGIWIQKQGDHELLVDFSTKDMVKISASHGDKGITVTCSYTVDKEGRVKAKITQVEERGINIKDKLPEGLEFNFTWEVKEDAATLGDIKPEQNTEVLKAHLEGKYERKK
jgi:hypothetical protein